MSSLKKFDLMRLFSKKSFSVPFSILCAFFAWLIIVVNQNPTREQVFTDVSAAISLDNTAASEMGLGIVNDISKQKFTVTVSGPNYIVSGLKTDDFNITVDTSVVNEAKTYTLDLIGNRNSSKNGYTFSSISPSTIEITVDYIDTKEYTITPKLIGVNASEGLVAEAPVPSNSEQNTIVIKGPRSTMQKIASVGSVAEVNKTLSSSQTYDSYVVLYDKNGDILYRYTLDGKVYDGNNTEITDRRLTLTYTSLRVTQPISKKRKIAVTPTFSDTPEGFDVKLLNPSVNYAEVDVIGTPSVIDKMSTLSLSAIDFSSISKSSTSFEISPNLPEGVKLVDTIDYFVVTIDTSSLEEKTLTVSNVKFTDIGKNLSATKNVNIKNVKICGSAQVISNVTANDIVATASLSEKTSGDYTVDVVISSEKYNSIWAVGSYTASVTLK